MNQIAMLWAGVFAFFSAHAIADVNVVVPGKAAGYLYMQGGGGSASGISLTVIKEAIDNNSLFKEYRIESTPPGLLCDESCNQATYKFPAGKVTLKIIGSKPIPDLDIPLVGLWSGGCHETTNESDNCEIHLTDTTTEVSIKVDPFLELGSIIPIPGGTAMYIDMNTAQGYMLVAAHDKLSASISFLEHDPGRNLPLNGVGNANDGRENMASLIAQNSKAAQHCQNISSDWYVPALNELSKMTATALNKVPGISASLWASTVHYSGHEGDNENHWWEYETKYLSRSSDGSSVSTGYLAAYHFEIEDGNTTSDYFNERQVLCFRRIPL